MLLLTTIGVVSLIVMFYKNEGYYLTQEIENVLYSEIVVEPKAVIHELAEQEVPEANEGVLARIHANMNLDDPVDVTRQLLKKGSGVS